MMADPTENLRKLLQNDPNLPTFPDHIRKILALLAQGDTPLNDIGREIEKDPVLALRLVRLSNSAAYGQTREVNSLARALAVVGLGQVKTVVAGFASVDVCERFLGDSRFDWREFWAHCGAAAFIARSLAERLDLRLEGAEFLGGLLHDIGYLALAKADAKRFREAADEAVERHGFFADGLSRRFGVDLVTAGDVLAEVSQLANETRQIILHVHDPNGAPEDLRPLVSVVSLANEFAHLSGFTFFRGSAEVEIVVHKLPSWRILTALRPEMGGWDLTRLLFDLEREQAASQDFVRVSRST